MRKAAGKTARRAPLALIVALAGALAVGGTAAWISTRSAEVVNTFESAEVTCAVSEAFANGDAVKKDVKVANTGDVEAYVRVAVVASWVKAGAETNAEVLGVAPVLDTESNEGDYSLETTSDWVKGADGYYYCKAKVAAGKDSPVLFTECAVLKAAPESGYVLALDVLCSAIQAEPDAAFNESWGASSGLVAADGKLTAKTA